MLRRRWTGSPDTAGASPTAIAPPMPLVWFLVMLLFFSAVSEKKSAYLLPLLPPGSVIIAGVLPAVYAGICRVLRGLATASAALSGAGLVLLSIVVLFPDRVTSILSGYRAASDLPALATAHAPSVFLLGGFVLAGSLVTRKLLARPEPLLPFLALGAMMALIMVPYIDLKLSAEPPHAALREAVGAARRLVEPARKTYAYGDGIGEFPAGLAYYFDRRIEFLGREGPAKLEDVPAGAALLMPGRLLKLTGQPPVTPTNLGGVRLQGSLKDYSVVSVINPQGREKDRVFLLEKGS